MRIPFGKFQRRGRICTHCFPGWHNPPNERCGKWTADGRYFVFQSRGQIWALAEKKAFPYQSIGEPIQLTSSPLGLFSPVPSKDGKKLFVVGHAYRGELERGTPSRADSGPFSRVSRPTVLRFRKTASGWPMFPTHKAFSGEARRMAARKSSSAPPTCASGGRAGRPTAGGLRSITTQSANQATFTSFPRTAEAPSSCCPKIPSRSRIRTGRRTERKIIFGGASADYNSAIRVVDLRTHQVDALPRSRGLYSPRWSPDGSYVVAMPADSLGLVLFDFKTQKWLQLAKVRAAFPNWSKDGRAVYFLRWLEHPALMQGPARRPPGGPGFGSHELSDYW